MINEEGLAKTGLKSFINEDGFIKAGIKLFVNELGLVKDGLKLFVNELGLVKDGLKLFANELGLVKTGLKFVSRRLRMMLRVGLKVYVDGWEINWLLKLKSLLSGKDSAILRSLSAFAKSKAVSSKLGKAL